MFRQTNASIPTTAVYQLNLILLTHRANMYDKRYVGGWYVQTFLRSWGTTLAFCLAVLVVGGWKISQAGRAVADENDLNQVAMWLCAKCVLVGLMRSYECVLGHGFDTDQILNNSYIHHDSICLRDLKSNDRALRKMDNKNTHTHTYRTHCLCSSHDATQHTGQQKRLTSSANSPKRKHIKYQIKSQALDHNDATFLHIQRNHQTITLASICCF